MFLPSLAEVKMVKITILESGDQSRLDWGSPVSPKTETLAIAGARYQPKVSQYWMDGSQYFYTLSLSGLRLHI